MKEILQQLLKGDRPKVLLTRMFIAVVIIFSIIVWTSHEQIIKGIFDSRVETVYEQLKKERQERYDHVVKSQVQSAYALMRPDSVMVLEYRPININEYLDVVAYEGQLPKGLSSSDFYNMVVSKISKEYQSHVLGSPYSEEGVNGAVYPTQNHDVSFRYSCPIYNLNNIYSGMVSYSWYDEKPYPNDKIEQDKFKNRLKVYCNQNARSIGRAK